MLTSILLATIVTLTFVLYTIIKRRHSYWHDRGIPHMKPHFFFGNMKGVGTTKSFGQIIHHTYATLKGTNTFFGMYVFFRPIVVALDPELIKNILVRDFHSFSNRGLYVNEEDDPISGHLFSLDGQKWKNLRAKLTPTFTSGKMKAMFHNVCTVADELNVCMTEMLAKSNEIDIKDVLARFSMDVIGNCAFGLEYNALRNADSEFWHIGRMIVKPGLAQQAREFFIFAFEKLAKFMRMRIMNAQVSEFFLRITRETIAYRTANNVQRPDFMNLLIQLKNQGKLTDDGDSGAIVDSPEIGEHKLTTNEIAAQCFVFFFGGFETSSTTMTFCLFELAQHLDIQQRVRDEIVEVLARYDGKITYEALGDMKYLDKVIKETLRKYPPIDMLMRSTVNDYRIPNSEHTISKGTFVFIPVYSLQNDPDYYPDPDKFDPERFDVGNEQNRDMFTYLPFGDGPRNCIGMRFGMMQTRVGLICVLKHFLITMSPNTKLPIEFDPTTVTLSTKDTILLNFKRIVAANGSK